ncbi:MAG: flippase-like domain-containing protein [Bacteroidia bacterium]|nr:flippase-like domain-containing protein [Bacteroidia bacterium]
MNKHVGNILKSLLGLLLGVGLLWLATRGQSLAEIRQTFTGADYWWVSLGMLIAILSHLFRALRWQMLLEAAGHSSKLANLFASVMVGYLVNLALPRAGELTRASLTARSERIPVSTSLGTIFTDRVFDLLFLGAMVLGVFLLELDQIMKIVERAFSQPVDPGATATASFPWKWVAAGVMALGGILFLVFRKQLMRIGLVQKVVKFLGELWLAVISVRKMKRGWLFLIYSLGIWVCYVFMTYVCFFALEETSGFGFYFALISFTLGGIGMVFPSPGGIGSYHYAFSLAFWAYWAQLGMSGEEAAQNLGTSLAFVIHTSQMVMMIVVGFLCYLYLLPKLGDRNPKS